MSQVMCELPPQKQKMFHRIQEVSRITGIKPYVLRYWETEFPALKPEKGQNDQRRYRQSDIDLVLRIKKLLYEEKFTIAGARRHIEAEDGARGSAKRAVRDAATVTPFATLPAATAVRTDTRTLRQRLAAIRQEVIELQSFLAG